MKLSEKLAQQIVEKRKQAKALSSKESPTADEEKQAEVLLDEADALEEQRKAAVQREERHAANDRALADLGRAAPRRTAPDEGGDPVVAEEAIKKDPKRGYRDIRAFLADVQTVRRSGRKPSVALLSLQPARAYLDGGPDMDATAGSDEHSGMYDPSLGFMVPTALLPGVLTLPAPEDPFPDTMRIPVNVPGVEIIARVDKNHSTSVSGGLRYYRRGETQQPASSSRVQVEKIALRADPLVGLTYQTEELLADAPGVVAALIEAGMRDERVAKRVQEIMSGTGVGENLGYRNAAGVVITVSKESGQAADTIVYDNLTKMLARCWNPTRWIANRTCIPQLAKLNAGTNGLVWQPSAREGLPGTLLGLPIMFTEYCAAIGDLGDIQILNPSQYIEVIRQDMLTEESIHVRFLENERTFRFTERRGGTPWWRSVLTPKNGETLSPFVQLEAR